MSYEAWDFRLQTSDYRRQISALPDHDPAYDLNIDRLALNIRHSDIPSFFPHSDFDIRHFRPLFTTTRGQAPSLTSIPLSLWW